MYFIISTERSSTTEYFFFHCALETCHGIKVYGTMLTGMLFMNLIKLYLYVSANRSKTLYLISLAEVT